MSFGIYLSKNAYAFCPGSPKFVRRTVRTDVYCPCPFAGFGSGSTTILPFQPAGTFPLQLRQWRALAGEGCESSSFLHCSYSHLSCTHTKARRALRRAQEHKSNKPCIFSGHPTNFAAALDGMPAVLCCGNVGKGTSRQRRCDASIAGTIATTNVHFSPI